MKRENLIGLPEGKKTIIIASNQIKEAYLNLSYDINTYIR
jgi:hypothetical protein